MVVHVIYLSHEGQHARSLAMDCEHARRPCSNVNAGADTCKECIHTHNIIWQIATLRTYMCISDVAQRVNQPGESRAQQQGN